MKKHSMTYLSRFYYLSGELKGVSAASALRMAIAHSGKSDDDIAAEMGWAQSQQNRTFSNWNYFPSFPTLPRLCEVLGNTILLQWVFENTNIAAIKAERIDGRRLFGSMNDLLRETSGVMEESVEAMRDGDLTRGEVRRILHELEEMMRVGARMMAELQAELNGGNNAR